MMEVGSSSKTGTTTSCAPMASNALLRNSTCAMQLHMLSCMLFGSWSPHHCAVAQECHTSSAFFWVPLNSMTMYNLRALWYA